MSCVIFLLSILAWVSGQPQRCALPFLKSNFTRAQPAVSGFAARQLEATLESYQSEHFVFWWAPSTDTVDGIVGDPAKPFQGDSIPGMVRIASQALESAWNGYVDTLGYTPPLAGLTSLHWNQPVPGGKYPVEICKVGKAINEKGDFFGVAYPDPAEGGGHSMLLVASDLAGFGGWLYRADYDKALLSMSYATQWREALRATCAHELFHAVQFNYEQAVWDHGFFEASAVAMESRMVPESIDYLNFARSLAMIDSLVPFPAGIRNDAYPQGWQVRSLMAELGIDIVKALWQSRLATHDLSPTFLSTLRQVLADSGTSIDSQLVRFSVRLALTGKRSSWHPPEVTGFADAAKFPALSGTLPKSTIMKSFSLLQGGLQIMLDTSLVAEDRVLEWIPDQGAVLAQVAATANTWRASWHRGSVRYSAATPRSVWTFVNPGNPLALRIFSRTETAINHYRSVPAPARMAVHAGQPMSWTAADGPVLTGISRGEAQVTPLLHLDVWLPAANKDPFAASVALGNQGHALVLEDADERLQLSDAVLRWDGYSVGSAFWGRGDGKWFPLAVSNSGGAAVISLGELDLTSPIRILMRKGVAPPAASQVPRPNPSRQQAPIHFPISGTTGSERLDILAADGSLVRQLRPIAGDLEVVWDLRNQENRRVRPGMYWYVWRGAAGSKTGQLLVAD